MDAKFYFKGLIDSSNKNSNNDTEKELDDVEKELDKIADNFLKEELNLNDIDIVIKSNFDANPVPEGTTVTVIKEDQDSKYVILLEGESPNSYDVIFINDEHFNYFTNKLVRYSTKDFIKAYLIYYVVFSPDNLINAIDSEFYYSTTEEALRETLALNDFKFLIGNIPINDIDIAVFLDGATLIFDENETKRIFNIETNGIHISFEIEGIYDYISTYTQTLADGNRYKIIAEQNP